jgi:hypothetical protein
MWEGTLQPRLNAIARMVTNRLIPRLTPEPLVARFDYSEVDALNENENEVADRAVKWSTSGAVTIGEVRKLLGLPPFNDERDKQILRPTSLETDADRTARAEQAAVMAERLSQSRESKPDEDAEAPPDDEEPPAKAYRASRAKSPRADRDTLLAPVRAAYMRDLASVFSAQRSALRGIDRPKALPEPEGDDIIRRAMEILSAHRWLDRLARITRGPIETALTLGATEAAAELGIAATYIVDASEQALAAVLDRMDRLPKLVNGTTLDEVREAIQSSLAAGEPYAEMQTRLDTLFAGYEEWRIDRIARTETTYAYAEGQVGQWTDAGIAEVDILDGDGDEPCAAANGSRWTLAEYEANPVSHPNCTRVALPVIPETFDPAGESEP